MANQHDMLRHHSMVWGSVDWIANPAACVHKLLLTAVRARHHLQRHRVKSSGDKFPAHATRMHCAVADWPGRLHKPWLLESGLCVRWERAPANSRSRHRCGPAPPATWKFRSVARSKCTSRCFTREHSAMQFHDCLILMQTLRGERAKRAEGETATAHMSAWCSL